MDEQIHWAKEAVGKGTVETLSDGEKEHSKGSEVGKRNSIGNGLVNLGKYQTGQHVLSLEKTR